MKWGELSTPTKVVVGLVVAWVALTLFSYFVTGRTGSRRVEVPAPARAKVADLRYAAKSAGAHECANVPFYLRFYKHPPKYVVIDFDARDFAAIPPARYDCTTHHVDFYIYD